MTPDPTTNGQLPDEAARVSPAPVTARPAGSAGASHPARRVDAVPSAAAAAPVPGSHERPPAHAAPPPRALPGSGEARRHVLVAIVLNKPGVLNRVSSLMRARNFNIDSLAVSHTD